MAEPVAEKTVKVPGLQPVPYVVVRLADGRTVLRHPDEVKKKA
jgi:hypothetical protein